jgi:hypothetical protein
VWERGKLPEGGGILSLEPGREPSGSGRRACPFSGGSLYTEMPFRAGSAVTFSRYHASRLLCHARGLGDANFFHLREHTLAPSYGD